jgi:hypothetical protein
MKKISSAPISNLQFRPRRVGSANASVPSGKTSMSVPKLTTRSGSLAIKRNARSGKLYHWAGRN